MVARHVAKPREFELAVRVWTVAQVGSTSTIWPTFENVTVDGAS